MARWVRVLLDWAVIALEAGVGIFVLGLAVRNADFGAGARGVMGFALPGCLLIAGSAAATIRTRRLAAIICGLAVASALCSLFWVFLVNSLRWEWRDLLTATLLIATITGAPGIYWGVTDWLGWPPVLEAKLASKRVFAAVVLASFLACYCGVCISVILLEGQISPFGDCSGGQSPFARQQFPDQAVFVATVIHLGYPSKAYYGQKLSGWAVARVGEEFWGLPWWNSRVVIVAGGLFADHKSYFIDGLRRGGVLSLGIPVVPLRMCGLSAQLRDSGVELRLLRAGPPKDGIRIIGRTIGRPPDFSPLAGVPVVITGPRGGTVAITDWQGIYDVSGLPPGAYSIRAGRSDKYQRYDSCGRTRKNLVAGDVWGCTLWIR
jgi:hypothetical protein